MLTISKKGAKFNLSHSLTPKHISKQNSLTYKALYYTAVNGNNSRQMLNACHFTRYASSITTALILRLTSLQSWSLVYSPITSLIFQQMPPGGHKLLDTSTVDIFHSNLAL